MTNADIAAAPTEPLGRRMLEARFPHPVREVELLETHISWVILTGQWAYKLKKPVRFDFLDYSSVQQRLHFCHRELQTNRVWAAGIYQDVVPIFGCGGVLRVGEAGEKPAAGESVVDHAVQMRQFPQSALLAQQLKAGAISPDMMEQLAADLAALHGRIEAVEDRPGLAQRAAIEPALENFEYLLNNLRLDDSDRAKVDRLQSWTRQAINAHAALMQRRVDQRRIRNCHGDLHLENLLYLDSHFMPFDGIEFSDTLRQIDVLSEIAFLVMELSEHGYRQHAHRLINRYVEITEDYEGLALLPYYLVYRAMVRAKVDLIRQRQASDDELAAFSPVGRQYLAYAQGVVQPSTAQLWITYGLSGSGKSVTSKRLVQHRGYFRLRSDVVRKHIAGLDPFTTLSASQLDSLYSAEMTRRTYDRLREQAQQVLSAGFSVIVDATFLKREQRQLFRELAKQLNITFHILHCDAPPEELERRILARQADPSDASVAVLRSQIASAQPPSVDEMPAVIHEHELDCGDQERVT